MDKRLETVKAYLDEQVRNHSIYVWGGSGTQGASVTEAWIRRKEASSGGGARANDAVAFWRKQVEAGYGAVLRAFDCSGLVSKALMLVGLVAKRVDCDGLWAQCSRIDAPRDGCLLFRVSASNSEDETHVGMYFGGKAYHAKGRAYGVVCEAYKASYWHKCGWLKALKDLPSSGGASAPAPSQTASGGFARILRSGMAGADVAALKALLIAAGYTDGVTLGNKTYGPKTRALVKRYQTDHGLLIDGKAGQETITALGGVWSGA